MRQERGEKRKKEPGVRDVLRFTVFEGVCEEEEHSVRLSGGGDGEALIFRLHRRDMHVRRARGQGVMRVRIEHMQTKKQKGN